MSICCIQMLSKANWTLWYIKWRGSLHSCQIALRDSPSTVSTRRMAAQTPHHCPFANHDSGLSLCILHVVVCRSAGCLPEWAQLSAGTEPRINLGTETETQRAGRQGRYWRIHIAFSWSIRTCYNSDVARRQIVAFGAVYPSVSVTAQTFYEYLLASFTHRLCAVKSMCLQEYVCLTLRVSECV